MQAAVYDLAQQAAATGKTQPEAIEAKARPVRKYRGVQARGKRFVATVWWPEEHKSAWLGSYATPEEAAYAYDAGARTLHRRWARPNFPEPPTMRGAAAALAAREAGRNGNGNGNGAAAGDRGAASSADAPSGSVVQAPPPAPRAVFCWVQAPAAATAGQHRQVTFPVYHALAPDVLALPAPYQQRARALLPQAAGWGQGFIPGVTYLRVPYASLEPALNNPARSTLSNSAIKNASSTGMVAFPINRGQPNIQSADESVVEDNFTNKGASSSAALVHRPLTIKD
ncbi:hypothetical protein BS78_10G200300 [Paspalum vaginatum]|nr:hypothetical protein BS78_10G200300 [Paspalum vaginatum]